MPVASPPMAALACWQSSDHVQKQTHRRRIIGIALPTKAARAVASCHTHASPSRCSLIHPFSTPIHRLCGYSTRRYCCTIQLSRHSLPKPPSPVASLRMPPSRFCRPAAQSLLTVGLGTTSHSKFDHTRPGVAPQPPVVRARPGTPRFPSSIRENAMALSRRHQFAHGLSFWGG